MATHLENPGIETKIVNLSILRSVLPDDHMNHAILRACETLELAINDRKKRYSVKVEVLMSVLENLLADCLIRVSPETTSLLFDYLLKHTLPLILHGDWGECKAIVSHMGSLFRRFKVRAEKKKLFRVVVKIEYLLQLIEKDPWGNVALVKILGDESETDDELLEFVKSELGVFLNVRLEVLIYARCEMQAMTLMEKCLRCISLPANREYFQSFTDEITHLRDLYLLILNKAKSDEYIRGKILNEVKKMGLDECLKFVNRCRNGELPFEILSKKSADIVVNMALALAVVKEDTDKRVLQEIIQLWFNILTDNQVLSRLLNHMVLNAACSRYIYCFGEKLMERVKLTEKELCVEVFVRGLTLNVNEIERYKTNEDPDKVKEHQVQLSNGFLQLAEYLKGDVLLHCECVLTAFSLNPSQSGFERIKVLGVNRGKLFVETRTKGVENDPSLNKQEDTTMPEGDQNQAAMKNQSELDFPPVLAEPVIGRMDPENFEEGSHFCEKSPPLHPQEPPVYDTFCVNGTLKNHSGQIESKEQIVDENQINGAKCSEETTHCSLSQHVLNLSLKDDVCLVSDHDKENNPENLNKSCFESGPLQFLQVYDAEMVGISQTLCDDLSTLVCSVKNQDLTWDLEWSELIRRCEMYVLQRECNRSANTVDCNTSKGERSEIGHEEIGNISDLVCHRGIEIPTKSSKRKRKFKTKHK